MVLNFILHGTLIAIQKLFKKNYFNLIMTKYSECNFYLDKFRECYKKAQEQKTPTIYCNGHVMAFIQCKGPRLF